MFIIISQRLNVYFYTYYYVLLYYITKNRKTNVSLMLESVDVKNCLKIHFSEFLLFYSFLTITLTFGTLYKYSKEFRNFRKKQIFFFKKIYFEDLLNLPTMFPSKRKYLYELYNRDNEKPLFLHFDSLYQKNDVFQLPK